VGEDGLGRLTMQSQVLGLEPKPLDPALLH
jgi:hypothetical protein